MDAVETDFLILAGALIVPWLIAMIVVIVELFVMFRKDQDE